MGGYKTRPYGRECSGGVHPRLVGCGLRGVNGRGQAPPLQMNIEEKNRVDPFFSVGRHHMPGIPGARRH